MTTLILKPTFTFKPSDFTTVEADKPAQPTRGESTPLQAAFDLSVKPDEQMAGKTPQKPGKTPWDDANDLVNVGYNFRMKQVLHKKMLWIADNVPKNSSLQKIIQKSVEDYVEKLLKEHYKG